MKGDRRRAPRRVPSTAEPLSRARLRGGRELVVLDLSDCGALVEGLSRLLPGTHLDVHLIAAEGRTLVRGRVVRAYVCAVDAEVVRYRGAIAFEHSLDTSYAGYALPELLTDSPAAPGTDYPPPPSLGQ